MLAELALANLRSNWEARSSKIRCNFSGNNIFKWFQMAQTLFYLFQKQMMELAERARQIEKGYKQNSFIRNLLLFFPKFFSFIYIAKPRLASQTSFTLVWVAACKYFLNKFIFERKKSLSLFLSSSFSFSISFCSDFFLHLILIC